MIKTGSYSRLIDFESCRLKAKLKFIDRIPDPRPNTAADRGTAIHQDCEDWVRGKKGAKITHEMRHFKNEFLAIRERYKEGLVSLEGEWGFDKDWNPCDYNGKNVWIRIKADAVYKLSPTVSAVIDYKSGKKFGNEIKHGEQTMLYSVAEFLRNPKVMLTIDELWYLDMNDLTRKEATRSLAINQYLKLFDRRFRKMTTATEFPPNPNQFSCRWCPYGPDGTGDCKVGISFKKS